MTGRGVVTPIGLVCGIVLLAAGVASGQWQTAQMLNDPSENAGAVKDPAICVAAGGGFHATYRYYGPGNIHIQYRRFLANTLSPVKTTYLGPAYAGGDICQAGNGDLHIVIESWAFGPAGSEYPEVMWCRSADGGLSWSSPVAITNIVGAKIPYIAPYGAAGSADVVMSCGKSSNKQIWFNRYNGTSWAGFGAATGQTYNSEYEIHNITQSLQDGSVYRSFCTGGKDLVYQRYNGTTWTTNTAILDTFLPRASIAVNPIGQVMICWDQDDHYWSILYTPGSGWGPITQVQSWATHGMVTAVPGTNNFYAAYCKHGSPGNGPDRVRGKLFANGIWQAEEVISVGQNPGFLVSAQVAAAADGNMYAVWEYWGPGDARAWFSVRPGSPPPLTGTLTGTVRDQYGQPVAGAAVTTSGAASAVTGANGVYSMTIPEGTHNVAANKNYYTGQTQFNVGITAGLTTTRDFVISGIPPAPLAVLTVTPGNTNNQLNWRNSTGAQTNWVRVLVKTGGHASGPYDPAATVLVNRAAVPNGVESFSHTGLTNGVASYYRVYSGYVDASAHFDAGAGAVSVPFGPGDHDHDGDVDMEDFGHFQLCLSGSTIPQYDSNCDDAKFDADADVDGTDLIMFRSCLSGPNVPANPNCGT